MSVNGASVIVYLALLVFKLVIDRKLLYTENWQSLYADDQESSCDSLLDNHNSVDFIRCNPVILSILAHTTGHNFAYSH